MVGHVIWASEVVVWLQLAQYPESIVPECQCDIRDESVYTIGCRLEVVGGVVSDIINVSF